ncbi:olfactory receptor class A-like protein 1 [Protopterus annectens]|uniref:olfactory receptor class A-like protein 1 n=1 Tax=Protopterus annectens TaxID=7888 RepID=UPI001CFA6B3C|nr:olfactory receptor class A-like protein 1 [Protopterus annectens]
MGISLIIKGLCFILLILVGVVGNSSVLGAFISIRMTESKIRPADQIISTLAFVNIFVILARGVPQTLTAFALKKLLSNYGCKLILYTFRVSRGMSICSTCMLSCCQAITVAPSTDRWVKLKQRIPMNTVLILCFLWGFNLIFWCSRLLYAAAELNSTVQPYAINSEFCFVIFPNYSLYIGTAALYMVYDLWFVSLMALASAYIVLMLYQHGRRVKSIRGNKNKIQGSSPETQAAKAVVALVTLYVTLFSIDNMFWIYTHFTPSVPPVFSDIRFILALSYAALSPIIIIKTNRKILTKLKCAKEENEITNSYTSSSVSHISTVNLANK